MLDAHWLTQEVTDDGTIGTHISGIRTLFTAASDELFISSDTMIDPPRIMSQSHANGGGHPRFDYRGA
jgi:hypothetical protein